jgi:hypothetical protein
MESYKNSYEVMIEPINNKYRICIAEWGDKFPSGAKGGPLHLGMDLYFLLNIKSNIIYNKLIKELDGKETNDDNIIFPSRKKAQQAKIWVEAQLILTKLGDTNDKI